MAEGLKLYLRLVSIQIRAQMQYRASFLFELLTTGLTGAVGFLTLALVLQRFHQVGGWTLGEVAFLYGMVEMAFGVMDMVFSGFDPQTFGRQIRIGGLDQMLLRPAGLTLQVAGSEFVLRRIGRIMQGGLVWAASLGLLSIHWTPAKLLYLPVVFASLVCFFGGISIAGATLTFWTVEAVEAVNIFTYGGAEMMSYPMHIYPDWMRRFFTYILPAIFLNYYPVLYILDKADPFGLPRFAPFLAPAAGFGLLAAGLVFWGYGLRHYQSTGT